MVKRHVRLDDKREPVKVEMTKASLAKIDIAAGRVTPTETMALQMQELGRILRDSSPSILEMSSAINRIGFSARRFGKTAMTQEMRDRVEREDQQTRERSIARMADTMITLDSAQPLVDQERRFVTLKRRETPPGGREIKYEMNMAMPVFRADRKIFNGGDGT